MVSLLTIVNIAARVPPFGSNSEIDARIALRVGFGTAQIEMNKHRDRTAIPLTKSRRVKNEGESIPNVALF
jgi:hypothetical protein